jgi:RimJ/RimL family protein N-acetyltransferase
VESSALVDIVLPRMRLRELIVSDVEALFELASDAEVVRFVHWPARTRDALRSFVEGVIEKRDASPRLAYVFAAESGSLSEPEQTAVLGFAQLTVTSFEHEQAELSGYLLRRHWGKGLATELGAAARDFAFGELRVHRLFAHCDTENVASLHVIEKLGLAREGTLRGRLRIDGVWRDSHLYAMLEPNWARARRFGSG